jgi:hypothetical protein
MNRSAHTRDHDPPPGRVASPPPSARGFSLMEVLMAAFVMGLGVLGLTALFAGAARQQQLASMQTRSSMMVSGAEALLGDRLGAIDLVDDLCNGGAFRHPCRTAFTDPLQDDVWYPVPMEDVQSAEAATAGAFLTLKPAGGGGSWIEDDLYFRLEPTEDLPRLLYRAAWNGDEMPVGFAGADPASGFATQLGTFPFTAGSPQWDGTLGAVRVIADSMKLRIVTRGHPCDGSGRRADVVDDREIFITGENTDCSTGPALITGSFGFSSYAIAFMDPKLDAADVTEGVARLTDLYVGDVDASAAGGGLLAIEDPNAFGPCQAFTLYSEQANAQDGDQLYRAVPLGSGNLREVFPGQSPGGPRTYSRDGLGNLTLNLPSGRHFIDVGSGNGDFTRTDDGDELIEPGVFVANTGVPWRYIHEVWVEEYLVRGHQLVSGADRVIRDASGDPTMGYTVLFRKRSDGTTQFALMSYAMNPAQGSAEDYLPPEMCDDYAQDASPVRLASVRLAYDDELQRYYVQAQGPPDKWAIAPNQVLMFAGDIDPAAPNPIPGADGPVTIQFVREVPSGGRTVRRGYLDAPPRTGLENLMVPKHPNNDPFSTTGVNNLEVWAVQPAVQSVTDGAAWNLEAVGATVFQAVE